MAAVGTETADKGCPLSVSVPASALVVLISFRRQPESLRWYSSIDFFLDSCKDFLIHCRILASG
jgi:hypothetical protein